MLVDILDKKEVADGFSYSYFCQTVSEFPLFTSHILQVLLRSDAIQYETRCSGNQFIVVSLLFVEPPHHFLHEFRPMTLLPCFSYLDFDCSLYLFDVIGHYFGFVSVVVCVVEFRNPCAYGRPYPNPGQAEKLVSCFGPRLFFRTCRNYD
jgi:hypothetical protein